MKSQKFPHSGRRDEANQDFTSLFEGGNRRGGEVAGRGRAGPFHEGGRGDQEEGRLQDGGSRKQKKKGCYRGRSLNYFAKQIFRLLFPFLYGGFNLF